MIELPKRLRRASMGLTDVVMERTLVYRAWRRSVSEDSRRSRPQRPWSGTSRARRGVRTRTNTHYFEDAGYLGIDINRSYVDSARRRHRREFLVADVRSYDVEPGKRFDFVLVNSFLHHIDTENVGRILSRVRGLLTTDSHVHVLELVLPNRSVARRLAAWDRGDHPRPGRVGTAIQRALRAGRGRATRSGWPASPCGTWSGPEAVPEGDRHCVRIYAVLPH